MVRIEIDGQELEVPQGQMIIEAADNAGIAIPRFCYHKKLSIAANCRMCLVEVGNAPKPMPACATPVSDGMKVFTQSDKARESQKAVMEFLLINHPLDCPVCDQGGQCELQDVAMEYGRDASYYQEEKRAVKDKNLGPLISTEMTRCIHCTRCVRFGDEIAGMREMGATGRGEHMEIGTYIEQSVDSELSGNIIDLCPVGALTSKPFRFQARAWEMQAYPSISPHDGLGANMYFHVQRQQVKRALPRENEALNEVWLTDRDRFSYEAFNQETRLLEPMVKQKGHWKTVDWETALNVVTEKLDEIAPENLGLLLSPNSTVEECFLAQKLMRAKGCDNIDHRLLQQDFRHQSLLPSFPTLGVNLEQLEQSTQIILIGCHMRKEQPLINHRIRKAALGEGRVFAINPLRGDFNYPVYEQVGEQGDMLKPLLQLIDCLSGKACEDATIKAMAEQLTESKGQGSVILGYYAYTHPQAAVLYQASRKLAELLSATWGEFAPGANSAGAWLAGAVPNTGLNAYQMWAQPREGYVLINCEPELDCIDPMLANKALRQAKTVVMMSAFDSPVVREYADVLLPICPITEMSGSYVNTLGERQTFRAAVNPKGMSKPAWKVLRVLANLWHLPGFDYSQVTEVTAELNIEHKPDNLLSAQFEDTSSQRDKLVRLAPISLYHVDNITRNAPALQATAEAKRAHEIRMHPDEIKKRRVTAGNRYYVEEKEGRTLVPLLLCSDDHVPLGACVVARGIKETHLLGAPFGEIELLKA